MLHYLKTFLPQHMRRQVKELFISTTLVNLALAMVMIFEPIYLYQQLGYRLHEIMLFYFIVYIVYFFIMPFGGKFASKKGYEMGILFGTFLYILFYIALFLIARYPILFYIAPFIYALQKMFYWPAYHADFARFTDDKEEGREISSMTVVSSLVYIIGPTLAGFIIYEWGYGILFTVASIIFLSSNVATLSTREKFKPGSFPYAETYKHLFSKKERQSLLAYVGYGEELIVMVVWPVFISIVITNVFDLGMIVTLATLITTIVTLYIGKLSDVRSKRKILSLGSVFYSLAWFFRIFIYNTIGVFFVDTMSRLGKNVVSVPLIALTYENAKKLDSKSKDEVMYRVVFFEMSLVVGKILAIVLVYVLTIFITDESLAFKISFILAGAMSLLYMLL